MEGERECPLPVSGASTSSPMSNSADLSKMSSSEKDHRREITVSSHNAISPSVRSLMISLIKIDGERDISVRRVICVLLSVNPLSSRLLACEEFFGSRNLISKRIWAKKVIYYYKSFTYYSLHPILSIPNFLI